jgi:hypothetical protein
MNSMMRKQEINQEICCKQNGRIAPMVEHCVEAAAVQVRILFRPQTKKEQLKNKKYK